MVCGGWFDLALKYLYVADNLEKSDVVSMYVCIYLAIIKIQIKRMATDTT